MTGTTTTATSLAVRRTGSPAPAAPGALAIRTEQTAWDAMQVAAFGQLGIKDAPDGDKAVFLHQCQRTGLDPFARQIYMIGRNEKQRVKRNGEWKDDWSVKWTIQTGIDGWRVIRDRAERREGVRGILSRFTYYDPEGNEHKVWVRREPPVACEVTYTVRDANGVETPYTSVLRMDEYMQTREDNSGERVPVAQWAVKDVHMLEKCTEADVYRKAFPQDYSGIYLDDAMPPADPDAPPVSEPQRQRVSDDQIRRRRATVTAEVVTAPQDSSPAAPPAAPPPRAQNAAGEAPVSAEPGSEAYKRLTGFVNTQFRALGWAHAGDDDEPEEHREKRMEYAARIVGFGPLQTLGDLTGEDLALLGNTLAGCKTQAALDALLDDGEVPGGE